MTDKAKYGSIRDPLSGSELVFQEIDGRRMNILTAIALDSRALNPALVTHNAALLLSGKTADIAPLAGPSRVFYQRSGEAITLTVQEGESGTGTTVPAVVIRATGSAPDLSAKALAAMTNDFMQSLCHTFDSQMHPAPAGGGLRPSAPRP